VSLSEILGSAVSGLAAAQAGLSSVSNNIANVGTPGYARERISLSTSVTAGRVTGVITGEPQRVADKFLEANAYRRASDAGRADVASTYQDRLQALLGAPGAESGLPARLDAIASSAVAMSASQASAQTRAAFVGNVEDAINSMQQIGSDVDGLRADTDSEVKAGVDTINGLLSRIHDLNDTVAHQTALGRNAAGAFDQRLAALDTLSGMIKVNIRGQPDGRVTIDSASGAVLLDKRLRQLTYPAGTTGVSQPVYAPIDVRFANADGTPGALTGERLDSSLAGGQLGGLLDLRDHVLPDFQEKLGVLFSGLARTLNAASNAGTAVPVPTRLDGRQTGLIGSDRLGFSGAATFSVVAADGTLAAQTTVDFAVLGAGATIDDAVTAINTGLGGAGTASYSGGKLVLTASGGNGIAVSQSASNPSSRAGSGFSQFFGLNDIISSADSALVPSGLAASDPHGFGPGEAADIVLRDASGKTLASHALTGSAGPLVGDVLAELNGSSLGGFGSFALDALGRVRFAANSGVIGSALTISSDSTDRFGTGRSFSALAGLSGAQSGLAGAEVRPAILANPRLLALSRVETGVAIGAQAVGANDLRGALRFGDKLAGSVDFGKDGNVTTSAIAQSLIGNAGAGSARATAALADATARRDDAVNRRDSYSGVNIDEELSQMVVLQNSYSASARVITTASAMYDTLLAMIR
jgi:flagellar hook-associated protein 1 FlgK